MVSISTGSSAGRKSLQQAGESRAEQGKPYHDKHASLTGGLANLLRGP